MININSIECREMTPDERAKCQSEEICRRAYRAVMPGTRAAVIIGNTLSYVRDPRAYAARRALMIAHNRPAPC